MYKLISLMSLIFIGFVILMANSVLAETPESMQSTEVDELKTWFQDQTGIQEIVYTLDKKSSDASCPTQGKLSLAVTGSHLTIFFENSVVAEGIGQQPYHSQTYRRGCETDGVTVVDSKQLTYLMKHECENGGRESRKKIFTKTENGFEIKNFVKIQDEAWEEGTSCTFTGSPTS